MHSTENEHNYEDNYPLSQVQKHMKEIELRDALRNYDKKIIVETYVYLGDSDGEITYANIFVVCQEKNLDSEMLSGIKSLASEALGVDIQDINYTTTNEIEQIDIFERYCKFLNSHDGEKGQKSN